jgi:hypothetical protein
MHTTLPSTYAGLKCVHTMRSSFIYVFIHGEMPQVMLRCV